MSDSTIPILPPRLFIPTLISSLLAFALLIHTSAVVRGYYYGFTEFFCRLSLTYYTICLIAASRARPVAFSVKWNIGIATVIVFVFTILIYESIPTAIRALLGEVLYQRPFWKLAIVAGLELAQVVVCGIIFQRSLEPETWVLQGPIRLEEDGDAEQEEGRRRRGDEVHTQSAPASTHATAPSGLPPVDASMC